MQLYKSTFRLYWRKLALLCVGELILTLYDKLMTGSFCWFDDIVVGVVGILSHTSNTSLIL